MSRPEYDPDRARDENLDRIAGALERIASALEKAACPTCGRVGVSPGTHIDHNTGLACGKKKGN